MAPGASPDVLVEPPDSSADLDSASLLLDALASWPELSPPVRPAQPVMTRMTNNMTGMASAARDLDDMCL
jgi:hypothetical protein